MEQGSTAACVMCGHRPNAVYQLYREVANDQATWTDAAFWAVIGALVGAFAQVGIEWLVRISWTWTGQVL